MALSWPDLVLDIEAAYPKALGGASRSEDLRLSLVRWANNLFKEIERTRRWSLAYGTAQQVTTPGTQIYPIPAGILNISNLYYIDTAGIPQPLENYAVMELRRAYGEGSVAQSGPPRGYSVLGTNIEVFPVPDASGPTAGNYTLIFEGYQSLTPIVETSGTTTALSTTLTVPSTAYLAARNVPTVGTTSLAVRGAGPPGADSVADTLVTSWSNYAGTTVTMTSAATVAVPALGAQVFFNATNWLILDYPKVVEFGVLREVATFLKDDYRTWEARFQAEMELMAQYNADRMMSLLQLATATTAQRMNQLRRLDIWLGIEVRGGTL